MRETTTKPVQNAPHMGNDVCLAGNPARNGICGDLKCVCSPIPAATIAEVERMRAYFPYRQIWVAMGLDIVVPQVIVKVTAHSANAMARKGYTVYKMA